MKEKDAQDGIEPGEPIDFVDLFLDARAEDTQDESTEFNKSNLKVRKRQYSSIPSIRYLAR